ncbi:tetratricopeptide repeat protein [Kiloniella majae]|uniref:tetratricopeptide repeat protein n=1 Tax=Kiloniella majae TaxID=1938558 RepID=UPI000A278359|nr:tetratricopeptide repeat protein [Kiloniella majae]
MRHFIYLICVSILILSLDIGKVDANASPSDVEQEALFNKAIVALRNGNRDSAVAGLSELAELNHIEAQYELATIFFKERGGSNGKQREAFLWYKSASKLGHAKAQHKLGLMYAVGIHVSKNTKEAIKWYHSAATQGLAEAQHDLGVFYVKYYTRNYINSYAWLLTASINGFESADSKLKVLKQKMAPHQIKKAKSLAEIYASTGTWPIQPARLLDWGFSSGVTMFRQKEYSTSFSIIYPLAQEGYPPAQYMIGIHYDTGLGAPTDHEKALEWYKKSALRGFPASQYSLVVKYAKGIGDEKNYTEAYKWLFISKKNGEKGDKKIINDVRNNVSVSQKKKIEEEALEWLAIHPKYISTKEPKAPRRPKF